MKTIYELDNELAKIPTFAKRSWDHALIAYWVVGVNSAEEYCAAWKGIRAVLETTMSASRPAAEQEDEVFESLLQNAKYGMKMHTRQSTIPTSHHKAGKDFTSAVSILAKIVREENYPAYCHQYIDVEIGDSTFHYIISRDDSRVHEWETTIEMCPDEFKNISGVFYQERHGDLSMMIDGHYYWATL